LTLSNATTSEQNTSAVFVSAGVAGTVYSVTGSMTSVNGCTTSYTFHVGITDEA
jgi:hypothetical protein